MQEQLISFDTAKLAKEKGLWQEIGFSRYDSKGVLFTVHEKCTENRELTCIAPTQSLLQKWLREKHQISLNSIYGDSLSTRFEVTRRIGFDYNTSYTDGFKTYEEALEKGLQRALKLINN